MKKVCARARALHQLIQQPEYRAISAPSLAGLGWVWAELSNLVDQVHLGSYFLL